MYPSSRGTSVTAAGTLVIGLTFLFVASSLAGFAVAVIGPPSPHAEPGAAHADSASGENGLSNGGTPLPTPIQHVVVVMMENQNYTSVLADGPFEAYLAHTYARATNDYSVHHYSIPAYLAATSGIDGAGFSVHSVSNIGDLADSANRTWAAFEQGMPQVCDSVTNWADGYDTAHNPFIMFKDIADNATRCDAHDLTWSSWTNDVNLNSLPNYSFITPNTTNDDHNSSISVGDAWLKSWLSPLINDSAIFSNTAFIINYDESGSDSSPTVNGSSGGQVYAVVVSPYSVGLSSGAFYSTYSLLTTAEWVLGLSTGTLGNDNWTLSPPMKDLLYVPPPSPPTLTLAPGADFPTYLDNTERTSSVSSEQLLNLSTAADLHLLWKHSVGGPVESQPVEQNGIVYFGSVTGYEYAVYATNGTPIWQAFLGQDKNDTGCGDNLLGVTSTASVVGQNLYVDGGFPYFYALNLGTGAVEWRAPIGGSDTQGFYDWASPLIDGNDAYVGISSDCDAPLVAAGVDEFSLSTHELVGYFNTSTPATTGSSIWGSPSLNSATNTIFVATGNAIGTSRTTYDESIISLNATTLAVQAVWQIPPGAVGADKDFGVTPTLFTPTGGFPMLTAPNKNGILYAFYQSNLTLAWQQPVCCQESQDEHISTAYGGGYVFAVGSATSIGGVSYNSSVTAFDPLNGDIVWQDGFPEMSFFGYAAPTWVNSVLIVPDQGTLIVLNANTGAVLFQDAVGGNLVAADSVARGELFAGSSNGAVFAFDVLLNATIEQSTPAGSIPLLDSFNVTASGGLPPYQYQWTFGDGSNSSLVDPSHTYLTAGTYDVTVSVTDLAGTVALRHLNVTVGATSAYSVTFSEAGLSPGTNWSLTYDGARYGSDGPNISLTEPNGTNPYSITSVTGYSVRPATGTATVDGTRQQIDVSFLPLLGENYTVNFAASGIPPGAAWTVTLNGSVESSTTHGIDFIKPNGSYAFVISGPEGFLVSPPSGMVRVTGSNFSTTVAFSPAPYGVTFLEAGLASGTSWTIRFNGSYYTSITPSFTFSEHNGTYAYTILAEGGYAVTPASGSVAVAGMGPTVHVTYSRLLALTFTETGLPLGTGWTLQMGGVPHATTTSSVAFLEPNGSYSFVVKGVTGYAQTPASGIATLNGAPVTVPVTFRPLYSITFSEHGLAGGTSWAVTVGGISHSTASTNVTVSEPNGTLSYTVLPVVGYTANLHFGSLVVSGGGITTLVNFARLYSVTFAESGLPTGTSWTVKVGGVPHSSTDSTVEISVANGTYTYSVVPLTGYSASPHSGTAVVKGADSHITVTFAPVYSLSFTENGLPNGTNWTVQVGGVRYSSTASMVTIALQNGTYSYSVIPVVEYKETPRFGSAVISGANTNVAVWFTIT